MTLSTRPRLPLLAAATTAVALLAAPAVAGPGTTLILDTRFVNTDARLTEAQCLTRAKTTLAALFKGNPRLDLRPGSHAWEASTPEVLVQVECLQYASVAGAYVLATAASTSVKADTAVLGKLTEALQQAVKAP